MATHIKRPCKNEIYFATFTYFKFIPLIEKSSTYNYCEKWFKYLTTNNCQILGYVVMPNHFHGLFYVQQESRRTINEIISNGKRFWAYEIIKGLKRNQETAILKELQDEVSYKEAKKGKLHEVFKLSFDSKVCHTRKMVETKLDYIHHNPVNRKWRLVDDFTKYRYSSASFYELQSPNTLISHYMDAI